MAKLNQMKNNSMLVRTLSGVVLLLIILLVGITGGPALFGFISAAGLVGLYELYKALGIYKKNSDIKDNLLAYIGFICAAFYYFVILLGGIFMPGSNVIVKNALLDDTVTSVFSSLDIINALAGASYINLVFVFTISVFAIMMMVYVFTFPRFNIEQVAYAFISFVYVPILMSFVYFTRVLDGGIYTVWLIFICSWVCDTCAYFAGTLLGKHKLAPILSPKKSIEGAIGGVLGSMLVAFIFGYFIEFKLFNGANNSLKYVIICFVGAIVSQVGDLAASAIKRNKEIKDYGNTIPGHGGILDRFDSVIFVAPFVFMLSYFF